MGQYSTCARIRCEPLGEHLIHWTSAVFSHISYFPISEDSGQEGYGCWSCLLLCLFVCPSDYFKNNERIYISVLLEVCSVQCSIPKILRMIRIRIRIQNPDLTDFHAWKFAVSD